MLIKCIFKITYISSMFRKKHIITFIILVAISFSLSAKVIHIEYYPNGEKKIELIKLKKGIVQVNAYYNTGQLKEKGYSKNGMFQGKWIRYNENGIEIATAFYHNDVKIGSWNHYDQWSQNTYKVYYNNGLPASFKQYGPDGNLIASGERLN